MSSITLTEQFILPGEPYHVVMEPKHIIVGYDGSPESKAAIAWAAGVAQRRRRTLVVATATGTDSDDAQRASSLAQQGAELAQQEADINVHALSPETGVVKALVELSREAELLVMGHRGRGRLRGALLGSAAFSVTLHAQCPVAITRENIKGIPSPDAPIVLGVDGSPESHAAAREAASLASQTGATLRMVVAHNAPASSPWLVAQYPDQFSEDSAPRGQEQAIAIAQEAGKNIGEIYPEVPIEMAVIPGRPERALVDAAEDASLIVVGARGRGDFASLLLGSVSRDVIQHADCTVYVVR